MPYYFDLRKEFRKKSDQRAVASNLLRLKEQLGNEIPDKDLEHHLLLATWNIRDFNKKSRKGFGKRTKDSLYYIAEIISHFDLVAVQEVNQLDELKKVMRILGSEWDYIATDVSDIRAGGNGERMTFVFDKRKVRFKNIAGEIVLPPSKLISKIEFKVDGKKVVGGKQFRRTPFIVSFQSGWFKFDICTVHIYYGSSSGAKLQERVQEISGIAEYLKDKALADLKRDYRSLILLGDFNIVSPEHQTMHSLLDHGFEIPSQLQRPSNIGQDHFYDQIAFITDPSTLEYIDQVDPQDPKNNNAGLFNIFGSVFRKVDASFYLDEMKKSSNGKKCVSEEELLDYFDSWRTYQMSDHHLMWARIKINNSQRYLSNL